MKIGFFGGAFNPPTNAHINLAKKAIKNCNLDKVIFVPMNDFYEKKELVKAKDRYNMLQIACKASMNKKLEVSNIEIKENRKLTTISAFRLIEKVYKESENYFIIGADNFINILNWKESEELLKKYKYIVFERNEINLKDFIDKNLGKYKENIKIISNEEYKNISSSIFRNKKERDNILCEEVHQYIIENKLY